MTDRKPEAVRRRWQELLDRGPAPEERRSSRDQIDVKLACGHHKSVFVVFLTSRKDPHVFCGQCRQFERVL